MGIRTRRSNWWPLAGQVIVMLSISPNQALNGNHCVIVIEFSSKIIQNPDEIKEYSNINGSVLTLTSDLNNRNQRDQTVKRVKRAKRERERAKENG